MAEKALFSEPFSVVFFCLQAVNAVAIATKKNIFFIFMG